MKYFFLFAVIASVNYCTALTLYWTGAADSNWSNSQNWSLLSGGPAIILIPTQSDQVIFDQNGNTDCFIDSEIEIKGMKINIGYTSTITQSDHLPLTIADGNFKQDDGIFIGSNVDIEINGTFTLAGGQFNSTSATLYIGKKNYGTTNTCIFNHLGGIFYHNNGTVRFQPTGGDDTFFEVNTLPGDRFYNTFFDINGANSNTHIKLSPTDTIYTLHTLTLYDGRINGGKLAIEGNLSAHYTYTSGSSSIHFVGNKPQSIDLTGAESKINNDVYFEKTGDKITLLSDCKFDNINQQIFFNSGQVISSTNQMMVFGNNTSVYNASPKSFVNGPARKVGNDAFTFPIGKGDSLYAPISISAPTNVTNQFTAEYFQNSPTVLATNPSLKNNSIDHISNCEFWTLEQTSGSSNVGISLSWEKRSCGIDHLSDLTITHWNGTQWDNLGSKNISGDTEQGSTSSINSTNSFGIFTLASITSSTPLPIELIKFSAEQLNNQIELTWETATEINNDFFTVERSLDLKKWVGIKQITATGNSQNASFYQTTDYPNLTSPLYYRLKQTDFNGQSSYSKIISINPFQTSTKELIVFPNPLSHGETMNIKLNTFVSHELKIRISNLLGEVIYSENLTDREGQINLDYSIFEHIKKGIYIINIANGNRAYSQTFTKN